MKLGYAVRSLRVVVALAVLVAGTLVASPVAQAASYHQCNNGWYYNVEVVGGAGGGVYVPAYGNGTSLTRNCWLKRTSSTRVRQEVRRLQYGLQTSGQSLYADGIFGDITRKAVVNVQTANRIAVDGVYGPQTGSVIRWCYWYNKKEWCGRWV
ncbi:peptidoglycan-binding domain-containing protein [Actinomyces succiniciruminis]|uniref:Peptidoglycan binding-like n=1 Tax=Actinomyces succiniciruminis TaxID=1522002 RepID=A0A1L7RHB8_9ACTO|nr:Peptidoglycan binding-like [Actinomyces succiniciruminis]